MRRNRDDPRREKWSRRKNWTNALSGHRLIPTLSIWTWISTSRLKNVPWSIRFGSKRGMIHLLLVCAFCVLIQSISKTNLSTLNLITTTMLGPAVVLLSVFLRDHCREGERPKLPWRELWKISRKDSLSGPKSIQIPLRFSSKWENHLDSGSAASWVLLLCPRKAGQFHAEK